MRTELQEDAAGLSRRNMSGFEALCASGRMNDVVAEVSEGTDAQLAEVAQVVRGADGAAAAGAAARGRGPGPAAEVAPSGDLADDVAGRRLRPRGGADAQPADGSLALALATLNPALAVAGAACVAIGWRSPSWWSTSAALLRDRALLDRWAGEATASLQSVVRGVGRHAGTGRRVVVEHRAELRSDEGENAQVADQVSAIDTELREHALAAARAAAVRGSGDARGARPPWRRYVQNSANRVYDKTEGHPLKTPISWASDSAKRHASRSEDDDPSDLLNRCSEKAYTRPSLPRQDRSR